MFRVMQEGDGVVIPQPISRILPSSATNRSSAEPWPKAIIPRLFGDRSAPAWGAPHDEPRHVIVDQ